MNMSTVLDKREAPDDGADVTELAGIDVAAVELALIEVGAGELVAELIEAAEAELAELTDVADPIGTLDVRTSDAGGLLVAFDSGAVIRTKSV